MHRTCGAIHLFVLAIGVMELLFSQIHHNYVLQQQVLFGYHLCLGISGVLLTLTAARDFRYVHSRKQNVASGPLEQTATVTYSEMMEHSFYQALNIAHVIYIHGSGYIDTYGAMEEHRGAGKKVTLMLWKLGGLMAVTAPWLVRHYFPVNHFSDNYTKGQSKLSIYSVLYRIKKYQYVAYKHFFLHGLNLTLLSSHLTEEGAESSVKNIGSTYSFRVFWLLLNTAYVMEFFLQSLVKKRYLSQTMMLLLNQYLMIIGTLAGLYVLQEVNWILATLSLLLNFTNRGYDFLNVMLLGCAYAAYFVL